MFGGNFLSEKEYFPSHLVHQDVLFLLSYDDLGFHFEDSVFAGFSNTKVPFSNPLFNQKTRRRHGTNMSNQKKYYTIEYTPEIVEANSQKEAIAIAKQRIQDREVGVDEEH